MHHGTFKALRSPHAELECVYHSGLSPGVAWVFALHDRHAYLFLLCVSRYGEVQAEKGGKGQEAVLKSQSSLSSNVIIRSVLIAGADGGCWYRLCF